jgi:16S rRNA processing protein RimM
MSSASQADEGELIIIARAVRTRGLKGEVVADILTDFPERFEKVQRLFAIAPDGKRRQLTLESHWFQNDRIVLKFDGFTDVDKAKELVGSDFALPEAERVELGADEYYDWELEGCTVETISGSLIGKVVQVMRTGGVELLVVESDARREILIPMVAAIVREIDIAHKKILIDPPEGLLDL